EIVGDIAIYQAKVPTLQSILEMPPDIRHFQLDFYKKLIANNKVISFYTREDQRRLLEIADHLEVPEDTRGTIDVRSPLPPGYHEVNPPTQEAPMSFISEAVKNGKILVGVAARLDP